MTETRVSLAIILIIAAAAAAQGVVRNPAVSEAVYESGVPIIEINTEDCAEIDSRETYVNMSSFILTDLGAPENDIVKNGGRDQIRGRGNSTWHYPKKPYRVRFREPTSLFGLTAQRVWVLLAEFQDPTFIMNAVTFELGRRVFGFPFTNSYRHVHLYLNDEYQGLYVLTEQVEVNAGRVDIDRRAGWLAEFDAYYDEEPKFRTSSYDLPVMIKSPEFSGAADMTNPAYEFVRGDIDELCDTLASPLFPDNGYRDLIDIDNVIDYLMINEIVLNDELGHPKSMFVYKDLGGKAGMGPLWDFDWGFGYAFSGYDYFTAVGRRANIHDFHRRFFEDPAFAVRYKARWSEKSGEIAGMAAFIDSLGRAINAAAEEDFRIWGNIPGDSHAAQVEEMADWWRRRCEYLNVEINRPEARPTADMAFEAMEFKYPEVLPRFVTILSYGELDGLTASFAGGDGSAFEVAGDFLSEPIGDGGYVTHVGIRPKSGLWVAAYDDMVVIAGENRGLSFALSAAPLSFTVEKTDPVIPEGITAVYGQTLSEVDVSEYEDWHLLDGSLPVGNVGLRTHRAVFAPADTVNYRLQFYYSVAIDVRKAVPDITLPVIAPFVYDPVLTLSQIPLDNGGNYGVFEWEDGGAVPAVHNGGYVVVFTPDDADNYLTRIDTLELLVIKADPYHEVPPPMPAVANEPLANLELPERWSWMDENASVGGVGRRTRPAKFTPEDTANYNILADIEIALNVFGKYDDRYGVRFSGGNIAAGETEIRVLLPEGRRVTEIRIYDRLGNIVFKTASVNGGVVWDLTNGRGRSAAAGTYLVVAAVRDESGGSYKYSARLYVAKHQRQRLY